MLIMTNDDTHRNTSRKSRLSTMANNNSTDNPILDENTQLLITKKKPAHHGREGAPAGTVGKIIGWNKTLNNFTVEGVAKAVQTRENPSILVNGCNDPKIEATYTYYKMLRIRPKVNQPKIPSFCRRNNDNGRYVVIRICTNSDGTFARAEDALDGDGNTLYIKLPTDDDGESPSELESDDEESEEGSEEGSEEEEEEEEEKEGEMKRPSIDVNQIVCNAVVTVKDPNDGGSKSAVVHKNYENGHEGVHVKYINNRGKVQRTVEVVPIKWIVSVEEEPIEQHHMQGTGKRRKVSESPRALAYKKQKLGDSNDGGDGGSGEKENATARKRPSNLVWPHESDDDVNRLSTQDFADMNERGREHDKEVEAARLQQQQQQEEAARLQQQQQEEAARLQQQQQQQQQQEEAARLQQQKAAAGTIEKELLLSAKNFTDKMSKTIEGVMGVFLETASKITCEKALEADQNIPQISREIANLKKRLDQGEKSFATLKAAAAEFVKTMPGAPFDFSSQESKIEECKKKIEDEEGRLVSAENEVQSHVNECYEQMKRLNQIIFGSPNATNNNESTGGVGTTVDDSALLDFVREQLTSWVDDQKSGWLLQLRMAKTTIITKAFKSMNAILIQMTTALKDLEQKQRDAECWIYQMKQMKKLPIELKHVEERKREDLESVKQQSAEWKAEIEAKKKEFNTATNEMQEKMNEYDTMLAEKLTINIGAKSFVPALERNKPWNDAQLLELEDDVSFQFAS